MGQLSSRLRRLDDALADLPLDEPMLLTELDGFLTGVLVCPELILPGEWLPVVWGAEESGGAPFDDPADVQWFASAVMARYNEIVRDLGRSKLQPIFDVDGRNGDVLWELWADGFAQAMVLRTESWTEIADPKASAALEQLSMLIAVARDESALDSVKINVVNEEAPALIASSVLDLHAARMPRGNGIDPPVARPSKVGRNNPCVCGSGKKFKRCCG